MMNRKVGGCAFLAGPISIWLSARMAHPDCIAKMEDMDKDGAPDQVVLENEYIPLVFTADGFGKAFVYKPAKTDVLGGKSTGLFHWDVFELPRWQSTSQRMPRTVRIVKNTPAKAAIEL